MLQRKIELFTGHHVKESDEFRIGAINNAENILGKGNYFFVHEFNYQKQILKDKIRYGGEGTFNARGFWIGNQFAVIVVDHKAICYLNETEVFWGLNDET